MLPDEEKVKGIGREIESLFGVFLILESISCNQRSKIIAILDHCQFPFISILTHSLLYIGLRNPYLIAGIEEIEYSLHYYWHGPRDILE